MNTELIAERIARCRLIGSAAVLAAVLIDPLQPAVNLWGAVPSPMDPDLLTVAILHSAYSIVVYVLIVRYPDQRARISVLSTWMDVLLAGLLALVAEGKTILFYPFFTFAILEAGLQGGLRRTLAVTAASILLWLVVVAVLVPDQFVIYMARGVYLFVVGYLAGYLGEQRMLLESEIRRRDVAQQRAHIARDLHDGYLQVLAAANLQLASCRELLGAGRHVDVATELAELQRAINGEHDEMRAYVRSLAEVGPPGPSGGAGRDPHFSMRVHVEGSGLLVENVLHILREGITNIRRHAEAQQARIVVDGDSSGLRITIDDDGRGFGAAAELPWSIASRVRQLGGVLRLPRNGTPGAHLEISLPAR